MGISLAIREKNKKTEEEMNNPFGFLVYGMASIAAWLAERSCNDTPGGGGGRANSSGQVGHKRQKR